MNKVRFKNKGVIDLFAVTTFGVSVKETDNPFGFFGTGLKYAIAILLRNKQKITIYRGLEPFVFTSEVKTVRGQKFDVVKMNDETLGFTLDLGKNWEMWQAFRELYCNTMDENGEVTSDSIAIEEDTTLIVVEGEEFAKIFSTKEDVILSTKPLYRLKGVDAHIAAQNSIYLKTILVGKLELPAIFTYNFTELSLTEDRTVKYTFEAENYIKAAVIKGTNESFITDFVQASRGTYEAGLHMHGVGTPSKEFLAVMSRQDFKSIANPTLLSIYNEATNKHKTPIAATPTDVEKQQLSKAIKLCRSFGYQVDTYPINLTEDLQTSCLGMAYNDEIYIARRTFMQGTKQVAATVLEEFLHLEYEYEDETYKFQTYLFDVIITLAERLNGEPV